MPSPDFTNALATEGAQILPDTLQNLMKILEVYQKSKSKDKSELTYHTIRVYK